MSERKFEHSAPRYLGYPVLSHRYWEGWGGGLVWLKDPRAPDEMLTHSESFVRRVENGLPFSFLPGDLLMPVEFAATNEVKSEEALQRAAALIMVNAPRDESPHGSPDHFFWVFGPRVKHLISDWAKAYDKRKFGGHGIRWSYPIRF